MNRAQGGGCGVDHLGRILGKADVQLISKN